MKKILFIIGALAVTLPVINSCERDITQLNVDPKHPQSLPSVNLFLTSQKNLFTQLDEASVNRNISRFFTQQWTETTYTDESNYDMVTRQINARHWNTMYRNVINMIKLAKGALQAESQKPGADSDVMDNEWVQMEIMEVYAWVNMVDTYNNIPYTDASKAADGKLSPKYDDAKTIYLDLIKRLDEAIAKIKVSKEGYPDYSYGGDMAKWKKLANSIKLRLGVNLSDVDSSVAKATVESAVQGGVIASNADNLTLTYTAGLFSSPLYQNVNVEGSGRKDIVAANTLVDALKAKNDPRIGKFFTYKPGTTEYEGGEFGTPSAYASYSHVADDIIKADATADFCDYAEVNFLLAEAAQRGFNVGGTAQSFYDKAVKASMDYWGVSDADATAYLAVNPYDAANWKKSLGEQSWFAMYNRGFTAWTFNRRLDYPVFKNPVNSYIDGVPTRMTYPATEQVLNKANWEEATSHLQGGEDVATAKVFWDKN
ncbi:SusD/RagB family nutrient-binding outer membrane lipoprotein [Riemerella columbipharyngis]|uniref:Starch-binding associating with outer membrane n=1 Tax=Riemerella columbipharyngis TaxID=1071918 RepID=A0A1G6YBJ6_9FLAO|nr:SusD/RagB family nutrient-binding outer membrane lipoprotein [Riemerella columbipharyngis]SDD87712.1 Starch-binding associating with outer membrane [Riemerella columbipharyngis]